MKIGSIVKWRYSGDKMVGLFIVVSLEDTQDDPSVGVVGVKSGKAYDMFMSDLEVLCE